MNQAQKTALVVAMIFLKALHVIFVHGSTHSAHGEPGSPSSESHAGEHYAYDTVMAVILAEGMKLVVSLAIFLHMYLGEAAAPLLDEAGAQNSARRDWEEMTYRRALSYAFPALIYMIEDNLRFVVLRQLHTPVTWMIFGHLEIPFVAIMSTVFLRRAFSRIQWTSVILLLNGVMASQLAVCESRLQEPCSSISNYPVKGILMVMLCALFAASAGIASEFIYKRDRSVTIWLQNCLLYSYAIGINLVLLAAKRLRGAAPAAGPWSGFGSATPWLVVLTMAGMGLCVSAVIKHMSNLAKVYTSALGIFVTALLSAVFEDFELSLPFLLAASEVVCALYLYVAEKDRQDDAPRLPPAFSPKSAAAGEKP